MGPAGRSIPIASKPREMGKMGLGLPGPPVVAGQWPKSVRAAGGQTGNGGLGLVLRAQAVRMDRLARRGAGPTPMYERPA